MPKLVGLNLTEDQFSKLRETQLPSEARYSNVKLYPATNVVDLSKFSLADTKSKTMHSNVRGFYEKQNALITLFREHAISLNDNDDNHSEDSFTTATTLANPEEEENLSGLVQSAVIASFLCNVLLLGLKLWMAILTGSMAIIASAVDSLLDLVSGAVLVIADRMAHRDVDFYKYPEGRSRVEPIGIIIFATVMCLSSVNILIECLTRIADGLMGDPLVIEVGTGGFIVLGLTIGIKLALYLWCRFVIKAVGGSASVEAYAQDHINDVLSNSIAVACVVLATKLDGWWIADPLGAAMISIWIMYSWWLTGKEHVSHLSGHTASNNFLQRCTFIAANCDDLILKVDTVRAFHFGEKFIVEIHVVLDEHLPLRVAHDVGEKLELMVEKLEEVDRCFVHMDYEYEHAPEYKRRQPPSAQQLANLANTPKTGNSGSFGESSPSANQNASPRNNQSISPRNNNQGTV